MLKRQIDLKSKFFIYRFHHGNKDVERKVKNLNLSNFFAKKFCQKCVMATPPKKKIVRIVA